MVMWLPAVAWALAGWIASTFFAPPRSSTQISTGGGGVYGTPSGSGSGSGFGTGIDTSIIMLALAYMLIKKNK